MIWVLIVAFLVSFFGSIPPGSINITVMRMAVQNKLRAAYFLASGATLVEFFYAGLAVKFQLFISERIALTHHFNLVTSIVLFVLGTYTLIDRSSSKGVKGKEVVRGRSGFIRGIVLGLFNPLSIPFWLAVTAYLEGHDIISVQGNNYWVYLIGVVTGSMATLFLIAKMGNSYTRISDNRFLVHILPGLTFLSLAIYYLVLWLFY